MINNNWQQLGEILRQDFSVADADIETALNDQEQNGLRLGEILVSRKVITDAILAQALATQLDLPFYKELPAQSGLENLLALIPIGYAKDKRFYPIKRTEEGLLVALSDPLDSTLLNDLGTLTGEAVEPCLASATEILKAINKSYEGKVGESNNVIEEIEGDRSTDLVQDFEPEDLLDTTDEAPIIRFVNSLITQGYKERASDIHIEPFENELMIRYRVDGILYNIHNPPFKAHAGIVSRIKIMSQLNIAEKRLPQDGRLRVRIAGQDIDVRVSTLPTAFGERVVLRLLDKSSSVLSLEEIGLKEKQLQRVEHMINKSHGVFLVTGPTGSGKTTTLYSVLTRLDRLEKNIITVEDPIEYQLSGVGQLQVNSKIDLTFANGLRSILRQDPDIIMVGEIRDQETAEIVIQSALTGHMVFSTLHTNDAAGALTRLVEMGVEPFLAASSIVGVMAQRLVRRICPHCREEIVPPAELLDELRDEGLPNNPVFFSGRGCERCMQIGYWGRTGIYELMEMDDDVRDLLLKNKDAASIRKMAKQKGMQTLRSAGLAKALQGETTLEEVLRVTQEEN
ncbi:type II secretion system protein E (GspE) [Desulfuromusa kysingii]|uniref:protein-secreting ATPase n=1 Tax=Desulfuromusa kysingii TaxID=37625 RepID=A0A1H4CR92_9BACT|nr:type II secretion system ATPase GspE [Desulfuromusa kysingii]SEA62916.1 type II secretion system protein E (GspE) [Desulfuromusa kysingii]